MKYLALILLLLFPSLAQADITTNLVDWYKFDENTGTTASDSGSGAITGTLSGTAVPSWVTGQINSGLNFGAGSGTNTRVSLASTITLTGAFTVAMWWNGTSHSVVMMAIGAANNSQKFGSGVTANKFFIRVLNAGSSDSTVSTPATGAYHFIVLKRDTSNICYLSVDNGADSTLFAGVAQSGNFLIDTLGNNVTIGTQNFEGSLDEIRIYSRLLSSADQTELFNYTGATVTPLGGLYAQGGLTVTGGLTVNSN